MSAVVQKLPSRSRNTVALSAVKDVRGLLDNDEALAKLADVAANELRPERMMRLVASAIRANPKLGECNPLSLLGALMASAQMGLEPNTPLGQAYLIPFENRRAGTVNCELVIGYKGYIDMAWRSGRMVGIHADVVHEGDDFEFEYGCDAHLKHRPGTTQGEPLYAYAHVKLAGGGAVFCVLPWSRVIEKRDSSQGYKAAMKFNFDNPWKTSLSRMARKAAIRELFNGGSVPMSVEAATGALVDGARVDYASVALNHRSGEDLQISFQDDDDALIEPAQSDDIQPAQERSPASGRRAAPRQAAAGGGDDGGAGYEGGDALTLEEVEAALKNVGEAEDFAAAFKEFDEAVKPRLLELAKTNSELAEEIDATIEERRFDLMADHPDYAG